MLDEIKKPLGDLLSACRQALEQDGADGGKSHAFFEKLSEHAAKLTGHAAVENKVLKYNRDYVPGKEENDGQSEETR